MISNRIGAANFELDPDALAPIFSREDNIDSRLEAQPTSSLTVNQRHFSITVPAIGTLCSESFLKKPRK